MVKIGIMFLTNFDFDFDCDLLDLVFFFFFFQKFSRVVSFEHSETFFFFIHYHKSKEMTSRDFARASDGGGLFF